MILRDLDDLHTVTFRHTRLKYDNLLFLLRMERLGGVRIEDHMVNVPSIHNIPHCFGRVDKTKIDLEAGPVIHH